MEQLMRNILIGAALLAVTGSPVFAAMDKDCDALFIKADINNNGSLAGSEATLYTDALSKAGRPVTAPLAREQFMTECKADAFKGMMAAVAPVTTTVTVAAKDAVMVPMKALVAGANSFTEAQARDRIEKNGLSAVAALKKDDNGIWRGTATKDSKPVKVALDFKGNIAVE
jgi:hypothetical protein